MTTDSLVSPKATARFVVTLPPEPSKLGKALRKDIASGYSTLTNTTDAFRHIALKSRTRFVIMVPYIDSAGASWAFELFELSKADEKLLILRDASQLSACGAIGSRLEQIADVKDYGPRNENFDGTDETFHAKIVLADGVSAYVGSANLLWRSKAANLECGMLVEGPAVRAIKVVVDAVLATFDD